MDNKNLNRKFTETFKFRISLVVICIILILSSIFAITSLVSSRNAIKYTDDNITQILISENEKNNNISEGEINTLIELMNQNISTSLNRSFITTMIIILITSIILSLIAYYFSGVMANPIVEITGAIEAILNGDYNHPLPELKYNTEINTLKEATGLVQESLNNVSNNIHHSSEDIGAISNKLGLTVNNISDAFNNISSALEEIATGTTHQAENIEDATGLVFNIADKMDEMSNISRVLEESVIIANDIRIEAQETVGELMNTSEKSKEEVNIVNEDVKSLMDSSKEITDAATLIGNISEQTNLLALNAAIEAARAGETGRGFAVVAEEIRKLAEDVMQSTEDINNNIKTMEEDMDAVVKRVESMDNAVNFQYNTSINVRQAFVEIDDSLSDIMKNITIFMDSINNVIKDKDGVVDAMQNISSVTEEFSASAEEVSAVTDAQTGDINDIVAAVENLLKTHKLLEDNLIDLGYDMKA